MKIIFLIVIGIIVFLTIPLSNVVWTEYGMICNNAVVEHLGEYSNVFVGYSYNYYLLESVSLPFGVNEENLQECVDFILEQRASIKLENMSPICQNAISDWVDLAHKIDKFPEDVARNMNMSSMPEEVLRSMHIFSQDVLLTDELLKQKNNATLAVLNHCDVESLTFSDIGSLWR